MKPGVNTVDFSPYVQQIIGGGLPRHKPFHGSFWGVKENPLPNGEVDHINCLIPASIVGLINTQIKQFKWLPVGDTGYADKPYDEVGSYRLSNFNPQFAALLFKHLQDNGMFTAPRKLSFASKTDWDGHELWEPIGINPLFRYIRYDSRGKLVVHYDAPYIESEDVRSLVTMIMYLTTNSNGATRFVRDPQTFTPVDQMDFSDWDRNATPDEVALKINPRAGDAVFFDHRMLHDSEPLIEGDPEKIIIRSDVMFRKVC